MCIELHDRCGGCGGVSWTVQRIAIAGYAVRGGAVEWGQRWRHDSVRKVSGVIMSHYVQSAQGRAMATRRSVCAWKGGETCRARLLRRRVRMRVRRALSVSTWIDFRCVNFKRSGHDVNTFARSHVHLLLLDLAFNVLLGPFDAHGGHHAAHLLGRDVDLRERVGNAVASGQRVCGRWSRRVLWRKNIRTLRVVGGGVLLRCQALLGVQMRMIVGRSFHVLISSDGQINGRDCDSRDPDTCQACFRRPRWCLLTCLRLYAMKSLQRPTWQIAHRGWGGSFAAHTGIHIHIHIHIGTHSVVEGPRAAARANAVTGLRHRRSAEEHRGISLVCAGGVEHQPHTD
mmetsp:Transcript_60319/g.106025  ORF Transcript_60319/g.106025 Transcript_60319/m.106025 type:complete len:342 (+) Transcript_60319:338-1363(+)